MLTDSDLLRINETIANLSDSMKLLEDPGGCLVPGGVRCCAGRLAAAGGRCRGGWALGRVRERVGQTLEQPRTLDL